MAIQNTAFLSCKRSCVLLAPNPSLIEILDKVLPSYLYTPAPIVVNRRLPDSSSIIFLICAFAETNRTPFDLPECETELVGGYHTEYSSMKLGFYLFAEYINMFVSSAVISTLYFGGYNFPFMNDLGLDHNTITIIGTALFFGKIFFFVFFFMWIRWTLPRFRYDQLMNLGWKILLPLSIVNLLITSVVIMWPEILKLIGS